jgi:MFS transporter, MHS family, alpha-ketoglutarate permease
MDVSPLVPATTPQAPTVPDVSGLTFSQRIRSIVGGSVGNLLEWYDWYAYSAFSLYFAKAFFPSGSTTEQLLNTAAIFAVGFLMRPIGGWLFGLYADKRGRKAALLLSVYTMCTGSLIIALSPTHASIGIAAPILLVFARLLQGLSLGGEYGTSAAYLAEMATPGHRGFYASFQYVTLIMGQLLAIALLVILQQILNATQLEAWGWRIPFLIGAVISIAVIYLRSAMTESVSFNRRPRTQPVSYLKALARHPRAVAAVFGLTMGGTVAFYTYATYMQRFLVNSVGLSRHDATLISAATNFIFMLLHPVIGALSDRVGRRPILLAFGILGTIFTVPMMTAIQHTHSGWMAFWIVLAALVIVSGYTSINAIVKAEMFPVEIRALGVGFPYAIAVSVFGGTTEYLALWLKNVGYESGFYWYVTACILCSLLVYVVMRETRDHSMLDRDGASSSFEPRPLPSAGVR